MASKSETGHAVNIANFKTMIDACVSYGVVYNPSNVNLTVANMTTQWNGANTAQLALIEKRMGAKTPINSREILFEPVSKLITRVVNHLSSTEASAQLNADAKGLADKIRGFGLAKPKKKPGDVAAEKDGNAEDDDFVSKSHMSFVQRVDNLKALIELLKTETTYVPNEADLTTASLDGLFTSLKSANDGIGLLLKGVDMKRISRNSAIYDGDSGLKVTSEKCKKYVKGLFGADSAEYAMISGLKFRVLK